MSSVKKGEMNNVALAIRNQLAVGVAGCPDGRRTDVEGARIRLSSAAMLLAEEPRDEEVAVAIRDHQSALQVWSFAGIARELHRWVEIFDVEFRLERHALPVIGFKALRSAYATYAPDRSEIGTRDNISFDYREFSRGGPLVLRTLLHELLHLWQHYHGHPGSGNYHNVEFRRKALACGLIVEPRGCTSGHTETFVRVLVRHGVRLDLFDLSPAADGSLHGAGRNELKMKKWTCGCTIVRCATRLHAGCTSCGGKFLLAAGGWS
jgi:hypothetical protein